MVRREKKFHSKEFKERVLASYYNSNESLAMTALRFQVKKETVGSWVYRKRTNEVSYSAKSVKFAESETNLMGKKKELPPEKMEARIEELEQQLAEEKMRTACLDKMIEIAERELKIDIRKKSGAKQSLR